MIRASVTLVLILFLLPVPRASAGEDRPICRVLSVLDVMAREVQVRDYYARIEPRLVDEFPSSTPNTVLCGVTVWTVSYDASRADGMPIGRCENYLFSVQALSQGFLVRYLRRGGWPQAQR
ncbi:MAG: hypothetical protein WA864_08560 [Acetobacteraceae bacterium]